MDIMKQASLIMNSYRKHGLDLSSRLYESDLKRQETFEYTLENDYYLNSVGKYTFSLPLAMQVINRNVFRCYNEAVSAYLINTLHPEHKTNLFGERAASEFEEIKQSKLLLKTFETANKVYENKKDTPDFDLKVNKITTMLIKNIAIKKCINDGMVNYKIGSNISIAKEWQIYLKDFNNNNQQMVNSASKKEENELVLSKQR